MGKLASHFFVYLCPSVRFPIHCTVGDGVILDLTIHPAILATDPTPPTSHIVLE